MFQALYKIKVASAKVTKHGKLLLNIPNNEIESVEKNHWSQLFLETFV